MSDNPFDQEAVEGQSTLEQILAQVHAEPVQIVVDFPAMEKKLMVKRCDLRPEKVDVATIDMASDEIIHYACGIEDNDAAVRFAIVDALERRLMAHGLSNLLAG